MVVVVTFVRPIIAAWHAMVSYYMPNSLPTPRPRKTYLNRLPQELHLQISEHLPMLRDRVALFKTSCYFYRLLAPNIYHTIVLDRSENKAREVLACLMETPRLAVLVRRLHIDLGADANPIMYPKSLWSCLENALRTLVNLDTLVVPNDLLLFSVESHVLRTLASRIPNLCIRPDPQRHTAWLAVRDLTLPRDSRDTIVRRGPHATGKTGYCCPHSALPGGYTKCRCLQAYLNKFGHQVTALSAHSGFFAFGWNTFFSWDEKQPLCPNLQKLTIQDATLDLSDIVFLLYKGVFPNISTLIMEPTTRRLKHWDDPEAVESMIDYLALKCTHLKTVVDQTGIVWRKQGRSWKQESEFELERDWHEKPIL